MSTSTIEPGTRLAGRYRLEERVRQAGGSTLWRATDEILARSVAVRTFDPEFDRVGEVVTAARAASRLTDPRLTQVFDADDSGEQAYVVSEWVTGDTLEQMVLGSGPLEPGRAATLLSEAAEALAAAHAAGLSHLRLTPRDLLWTTGGTVKLLGVAVDAALAGITSVDPARVDARGLGHLLYAALTGHWPGDSESSLPSAPLNEGEACPPREVKSGISFALDTLVCRAIGVRTGPGQGPLDSPAAVAKALAGVPRTPLPLFAGLNPGPPPSIIPRQPRETGAVTATSPEPPGTASVPSPPPPRSRGARSAMPPAAAAMAQPPLGASGSPAAHLSHGTANTTAAHAHAPGPAQPTMPSLQREGGRGRAGGTVNRPLVAAATAAAVLIVGLGAWQLNQNSGKSGNGSQVPTTSPKPTPKPTPSKLKIVSAEGIDPAGNDNGKGTSKGHLTIDGKQSPLWHTSFYASEDFGRLKSGVGVLLDLGKSEAVDEVRIQTPASAGAVLELKVGDSPDLTAADKVASTTVSGPGTVTLRPSKATTGRYVLVWCTKLSTGTDGKLRIEIAEITAYGSAS